MDSISNTPKRSIIQSQHEIKTTPKRHVLEIPANYGLHNPTLKQYIPRPLEGEQFNLIEKIEKTLPVFENELTLQSPEMSSTLMPAIKKYIEYLKCNN